jgi:formamidase
VAKVLISVDPLKSVEQQPIPLHNRWHPAIPPTVRVNPEEEFRIECIDWTGGQIKNNDDAHDIRTVDLSRVHYLSGPIYVNGAQPGDLLVVDILDIGTFPEHAWGFTGIFDRSNGGGFLTDYYPDAAKAIWDLHGVYATSRHIPHVKIAGMIHPGLIGCAPSEQLLAAWNKREKQLVDTNPLRVPPLANLPLEQGALVGMLQGKEAQQVVREGARTVPPRENGGNCDIKNLSRGSRVFLPVYVPGAHLSMGDIHFSQGDGEITFCGAIEMAGWIDAGVSLIKDGMNKYKMMQPFFMTGPFEPRYDSYLVFEGISVDEQGNQHYLDASLSYRRACLNAIEYLKNFGYTDHQAYILLSTVPVEGRISGIVDIPNACCTVALPTGVFDFDILPDKNGPRIFKAK